MSLKIYFLRHGQTDCSRANVFCGAGTDAELTPEGQQMALSFAEIYKTISWAAVYVSPLKRTIATSKPLCDVLGLKPELRDGLKEIHYGEWEGKTSEEVTRTDHDTYLRWSADPAWFAPTGGEPAVLISRRALEVIEEIRKRHATGNILVVSHKATIRVILSSLLGIDVGRYRYRLGCPVGSVSIVEFGTHGPLLHALADRSHLNAELRNLPGT